MDYYTVKPFCNYRFGSTLNATFAKMYKDVGG